MSQHTEHHRRALDALLEVEGDISKLDTRDFVTLIHADLQEIRNHQLEQTETLVAVKEILVAWDDAKGFIKIVKLLGNVAKWLTGVGAALGLIWYWWKKG